MALTIGREDPQRPEVAALVAALDAYQSALYPPESNHFLDLAALAQPDLRFLVAREAGRALGCGALRVVGAPGAAGGAGAGTAYGEIKRMFVLPEARGRQLGARLLAALEATARAEGLAVVRLETGIRQPAALALYARAGYRDIPPFGGYAPDPLSRFMEKRL